MTGVATSRPHLQAEVPLCLHADSGKRTSQRSRLNLFLTYVQVTMNLSSDRTVIYKWYIRLLRLAATNKHARSGVGTPSVFSCLQRLSVNGKVFEFLKPAFYFFPPERFRKLLVSKKMSQLAVSGLSAGVCKLCQDRTQALFALGHVFRIPIGENHRK